MRDEEHAVVSGVGPLVEVCPVENDDPADELRRGHLVGRKKRTKKKNNQQKARKKVRRGDGE